MIVSHQWFLCPFAVGLVSCTKEQHRYPHSRQQSHTVLILKLPKTTEVELLWLVLLSLHIFHPLAKCYENAMYNKTKTVAMNDNLLFGFWKNQDFWQPEFCCFCCVSFSLEAPSPIPAASLFWACHHIYFVLHLCVAFLIAIVLLYSSRMLPPYMWQCIHVKHCPVFAQVWCLFWISCIKFWNYYILNVVAL